MKLFRLIVDPQFDYVHPIEDIGLLDFKVHRTLETWFLAHPWKIIGKSLEIIGNSSESIKKKVIGNYKKIKVVLRFFDKY